jgi:P27 family predicted phage terminase small subunit
MGVLTVADTLALERLCDIYADILQLRDTIAVEGRTYTVQTEGGFLIKANPAVSMLADADRRFKSYLVEFGLTPAARTKVKVNGETPKKTRSTSSSVDPATQYAKDVTSGKELAGPDIRNACQRHLRDLESCHARGLHWDVEAAQRSIDYFAKVLKLNGAILKVRLLFCFHGSVSSSVRFLAGKMPEVFAGSEWFTWNQEKDLENPPFCRDRSLLSHCR